MLTDKLAAVASNRWFGNILISIAKVRKFDARNLTTQARNHQPDER